MLRSLTSSLAAKVCVRRRPTGPGALPRVWGTAVLRRSASDITGCSLRATVRESLTAVDDSIMRIITGNDKEHDYNALQAAQVGDPNCAMLHLLALWTGVRGPRRGDNLPPAASSAPAAAPSHWTPAASLRHVCALQRAKKLTPREQHYLAAFAHYAGGHYLASAQLLESLLVLHPNDTLAMKIAQEVHVVAGNPDGALSCVTRHMPLIGGNHALRRNVLGVLAQGFVEGRLAEEADETAQRAVEMTSMHDLTAVGAHVSSLLVGCRATEASGFIDHYKERHYKTPVGQAFFGFYTGFAQALRGNNSAAIREIGLCLDAIEACWVHRQPLHLSLLADATLLLWYVTINIKSNNHAMGVLWSRAAALWVVAQDARTGAEAGVGARGDGGGAEGVPCLPTPMQEVCASLALTLATETGPVEEGEEGAVGGIPPSPALPLHLMEYENLNSQLLRDGDRDRAGAGAGAPEGGVRPKRRKRGSYVVDNKDEYYAEVGGQGQGLDAEEGQGQGQGARGERPPPRTKAGAAQVATSAGRVRERLFDFFSFGGGRGSSSDNRDKGEGDSGGEADAEEESEEDAIPLLELDRESLLEHAEAQWARLQAAEAEAQAASATVSGASAAASVSDNCDAGSEGRSTADDLQLARSCVSPLLRLHPVGGGTPDRSRMLASFGAPFARAVRLMSRGEYAEAAEALVLLQQRGGGLGCTRGLGTSVLHSAVLEATVVEALMRCGRWEEATALLLHRTTVFPNDAQSWRRLGLLMHVRGPEYAALAESARCTAYELGIGQGGYGGSQA